MWILLAFVAAVFAAEPPSVAVLPLAKGAASAQYEGLGRALAGMLVSDLSTLPGLRIVERDQLDALLAEMKLKETGFLDPASAQKLGRGVGAQYLVLGSFTVLDPQFVLDARVVAVQSGEVVKAASAAGTVADFVSVEKELVEGLATGLDLALTAGDRRKLGAQVPTEKFSAFSAFGQGLALEQAGKVDEAGAAYRRALAEDPAFEEARRALDALSAAVAAVRKERADAAAAAANAVHARVLAEIPDDRTRPAAFVHTADTWADFALRVTVLDLERRDCDLYGELGSLLTRAGWRLPEGDMSAPLYARMRARGFDAKEIDAARPTTFEQLGWYLTETVKAAAGCHPAERAAKEIDTLRQEVAKRGLDGTPTHDGPLGTRMELLWATAVADGLGATPELTRRVEALLARDTSPDMEAKVGRILDLAEAWVRRRGLPKSEVARRVRRVAQGKFPATPVCARASTLTASASAWLADYEKYSRWWASPALTGLMDDALPIWAPASDLGCVEGAQARFESPTAALAWFEAARARVESDCEGARGSFEAALGEARSGDAAALLTVDVAWTTLVARECARE